MSEPTVCVEWPEGPLGAFLLLVLLLVIALDLGRSATERLTVAIGSIRLRPPTIVPMAEAETVTAAQLLGGAMADYFASPGEEPTP